MRSISVFSLLLLCQIAYSQADLSIGNWKSYLPYKYGWSVTQSQEAVFYGTQWSLLKINKEDLSLEYFSKVEGLHDIGIQSVDYGDEDGVLIIIYSNSNIDLVYENEIVNLNQIQANTQIVEDRTVHDVAIKSPHAYLACGFGLVQLNLVAGEFGFTTFTSTPVFGVAIDEDELVISTEEGIYTANVEDDNNLADFSIWEKKGFIDGLPEIHQGTRISSSNGSIFVGIDDEVYQKNGARFKFIHQEPGFDFQFAAEGEEGLLTGWKHRTGGDAKKKLIANDGAKKTIVNCSRRTLDAVVDEENRVWYADQGRDYRYSLGFTGDCLRLTPDRPPTHNVAQITSYNKKLYVATGGVSINYGYLFRTEGFYTNETDNWISYNLSNVDILKKKDMRDFVCIEAADDGTIYVGTFWDGLIQYRNGDIIVFDQDNSSLQNSVINPDFNRVTDLDFDVDGNLWMLNHDAPLPISVFTRDGEWKSFGIPTNTNVEHLAVDQVGNKWISVGGIGLVVFDSGDDLLSTSDDRYLLLNSTNSELTVNSINDLAADGDGGVWVGSSEGLVFFNCGNFTSENDCFSSRPIVIQNGIPGELLGEENVKAIAVDGANQKWFGTNNGVFVQSADGETQVHAFNIRNSPLFDNGIIDIAIDGEDGEVFIATNKGLQSFRGEATSGTTFHTSTISVFPNPVRPGYTGPIAIKGLAENADVKITDIDGLLVFETTAKGGQAIWYGTDFSGRRASSGVYLVYSTSTQVARKPDAAVTKIMLIN